MKRIIISILLIVGLFSVINIKAANSFKITNVKVVEKQDTVDVNDLTYEELTLNSDVVFHKVGDYIIYEITLKNETGYDYTLKTLALTSNNAYIEYSCEDCNDLEIKNKEEKIVHLKTTYKTQVANMSERARDENFEVQLTLIDNNKDETIENPKTGKGIRVYTILGIIVALGIMALIGLKKTKSKIVSIIVLVLLIPIIVKAQDGALRLNINIKYNLLDRVVVSKDNNGTVTEQIVEYGETIEVPANPERAGYTFNGWYVNGEKVTSSLELTGDIEFEARYTPITYTISYNLNGGSITGSNPGSYTIETGTDAFNNPIKSGYYFIGWQEAGKEGTCNPCKIQIGVYGNKTYTAIYTDKLDIDYTVVHKYEKLDGTYKEVTIEGQGTTGDSVPFRYDNEESDAYNIPAAQSLLIDNDGQPKLEYEYIYSRKTYTLTLNDSEYIETNKESGTYKYGTVITLTAKTKTGYTFVKWSNNETDNPYTFNLTENTTIGPVYTPNTNTPYVIKRYIQNINDDGYTEDVSNRYEGQGTTNDSISAYDISDYEGKYEKNTSHTDYQASGTILPDGSTVLRVYYTRVVYDVTFEADGGTEITQQHIRYGGKVTVPTAPTKEHYVFKGWYKDSDFEEEYDFNEEVTENITIYAKWGELLADKIIYNAQSENLTPEQITSLYAVYTEPADLPTQPAEQISGANESILSKAEDDYGDSYYFRGNVANNYLNFAGMCWRIVRIAGNGNVKLILEDQSEECSTEMDGNWNIGKGHYGVEYFDESKYFINYSDNIDLPNHISSTPMSLVFKNYQNTLEQSIKVYYKNTDLTLENYLESGLWCMEDTGYDPNSGDKLSSTDLSYRKNNKLKIYYTPLKRIDKEKSPKLECQGTKLEKFSDNVTNMYVAALTADEIAYSGGKYGAENKKYYLKNNYMNDSSEGTIFLTLSPAFFNDTYDRVFTVTNKGKLLYDICSKKLAIRPSIVLKTNTTISSGNGAINNPYVVE